MNFEKTRILSSDVMKLLKQVFSEQKISVLEKDLLKEKLRAMYEALDEEEVTHSSNSLAEVPFIDSKIEEEPVIEPVYEMPDVKPVTSTYEPEISRESFEFEQEEIVEAQTLANQANEEPIHTGLDESRNEEQPSETSIPIQTMEEADDQDTLAYEPAGTPIEETTMGIAIQEVNTEDQEAIEDLFYFQEARELSDRLGLSPIADLTKALGINDRLLTVNELFGGDFAFFDESFRRLNSMDSFDEAKVYLKEHLVVEKGWIQPDKKDRAKRFIKFVRRRYLNT